jgi:hypothetical protein
MHGRMDLHHEILLRLLKNELHTAPLKNPQHLLDVGTGRSQAGDFKYLF